MDRVTVDGSRGVFVHVVCASHTRKDSLLSNEISCMHTWAQMSTVATLVVWLESDAVALVRYIFVSNGRSAKTRDASDFFSFFSLRCFDRYEIYTSALATAHERSE
jgi:hypothetical protein